MKYISTTIRAAVFLIVMLLAGPLAADGGFFSVEYTANDVSSPAQRSILFYYQGRETLVLNTGFQGGDSDFAWVIPLPVAIVQEDVAVLDEDPFTPLYDITEPVYSRSYIMSGCGCASAQNSESTHAGINIENTLTAGSYNIVVLSATDSQNLTTWLKDNGYRVKDEHEPIIGDYINRGFHFAAVKVNNSNGSPSDEDAANTETIHISPLRISFATSDPVYPLLISQVSSPEYNNILLYVISDTPLKPSNYTCYRMDTRGLSRDKYFPETYNIRFHQILDSSDNRTFILEYAEQDFLPDRYIQAWFGEILDEDECRNLWLLRYRSILSKDKMDEDLYFTPYIGIEPLRIYLTEKGRNFDMPIMIASIMAFALIIRARRR